jgi:hypothetical protein
VGKYDLRVNHYGAFTEALANGGTKGRLLALAERQALVKSAHFESSIAMHRHVGTNDGVHRENLVSR